MSSQNIDDVLKRLYKSVYICGRIVLKKVYDLLVQQVANKNFIVTCGYYQQNTKVILEIDIVSDNNNSYGNLVA